MPEYFLEDWIGQDELAQFQRHDDDDARLYRFVHQYRGNEKFKGCNESSDDFPNCHEVHNEEHAFVKIGNEKLEIKLLKTCWCG